MNKTPRANRVHIAIFGKRNSGKSSLINALTGQDIALVSSIRGTTTDPVFKSMEILPIGPVVLIDTAGLDDLGELGELRVKKTIQVLNKTDLAIIVIDAESGITEFDYDIIKRIKDKKLPAIIVVNKIDLGKTEVENNDFPVVYVSSKTNAGINDLREELGKLYSEDENRFRIVGDLINPGDFVVLVTPIDSAAPKGRVILPQQQVLRDILDHEGIGIVTREFELEQTLNNLKEKPSMVITDSQAFEMVSKVTPEDIPLTSFSILFARYKGDLEVLKQGARTIETLSDGAKILVAEGCTHHRQKDDIGTVKIPKWLKEYTGKDFKYDHYAGHGFPENVGEYDLIIHCGACMLNRKEVMHRINTAQEMNIPIVNYGVLIAYIHKIFNRTVEII